MIYSYYKRINGKAINSSHNYYISLTAFFIQDNLGKPAPER